MEYSEMWRDFLGMAWFLSLINCLAKTAYMIMLMVMSVKEHGEI